MLEPRSSSIGGSCDMPPPSSGKRLSETKPQQQNDAKV